MAAAITGGGRAAVQRNLALMEARGLIREVTGQGRFRMWCIANSRLERVLTAQLAVAMTASARQGAQKLANTKCICCTYFIYGGREQKPERRPP